MKCPKCNQESLKGELFCGSCGEPIPQPKPKSKKTLVSAVVAVALVALIVAGIFVLPKLLNTPVTPTGTETPSDSGSVVFSRDENMMTLRYYYISQWLDLCSTTNQYIQYYGSNVLGFDISQSPENQTSQYEKEDGSGEFYTWGEYLLKRTCEYVWGLRGLYLEAVESGLALTEADNAQIQEQLASLASLASERNMTSDEYLSAYYGDGIDLAFVTTLLERQVLAVNYNAAKSEEFSSSVSDEEVEAVYATASDDYNAVSFLLFNFNDTDFDDPAAAAEAFLADVDSPEDFFSTAQETYAAIDRSDDEHDHEDHEGHDHSEDEDAESYDAREQTSYSNWVKSNISSYISDDLAVWLFADERAVGDAAVISGDSTSFAVYMIELPHEYSTIDVRHILFKSVDDSQNPLPDEEIKAAADEARRVYDEWLAGDRTEESFAALAKEHTADSNKETGGLYEDVSPNDMTSAFDEWCFDEARKPGDSDIVETEYGYHVMYFVGRSEQPTWRSEISAQIGGEKHSAYVNELMSANSSYLPYDTQETISEYKVTLTLVQLLIDESTEDESTTIPLVTLPGSVQ